STSRADSAAIRASGDSATAPPSGAVGRSAGGCPVPRSQAATAATASTAKAANETLLIGLPSKTCGRIASRLDAASCVHHESRTPLRDSPAVQRQPELVLELADQRSRIAFRTEMLDRLQRVGGVQYDVGHPASRFRRIGLHEDIRADV